MEDVQGDGFNFCSFLMGITRSPMDVTRQSMVGINHCLIKGLRVRLNVGAEVVK